MSEKNNLGTGHETDLEKRKGFLENFALWIIQSGLDPLEHELVEETRSDGAKLWYFRKRTRALGEIQSFETIH